MASSQLECINTMASRPQAHSLNEKERQDALAAMDLVKIIRSYILAIVSAPGYKALICDKETMRVACTLLGEPDGGARITNRNDSHASQAEQS